MWYRIVLAALIDVINTFSPEHQEFLGQIQDTRQLGLLVNLIKKNPQISIPELTTAMGNETTPGNNQQVNTPEEIAIAENYSDPIFQTWVLTQLRKMHKTLDVNKDKTLSTNEQQQIYRTRLRELHRTLSEIFDWYRLGEIKDISSYDIEKAEMASDQWHATMAGQGEGLIYEPTEPYAIMLDLNYDEQHPNWDGWTIQEVSTKNDLQCEGNLMNHCVGGYGRDVQSGSSRIFSLRDPQNRPHATIETDNSGTQVRQIKGNSNDVPKREYQEMIKFWVANSDDTMWSEMDREDEDSYYDQGYDPYYVSEVYDAEEFGNYIGNLLWAQDHPSDEEEVDYESTYGLRVEVPERREIELNEAYADCITLLKKYLKWIQDKDSWNKKTPKDYLDAIETLSGSLIDSAVDHDKAALEQYVKEGTKANYWWDRLSYLSNLKDFATDGANDEIDEFDGEEEELMNISHNLAQNRAMNVVGRIIDINNSDPQTINNELKNYWTKKLQINENDYVDPQTGEFNQVEFMGAIQSKYSEYLQSLESQALIWHETNGETPMSRFNPEYDLAFAVLEKVDNALSDLRPLISQVIEGTSEMTPAAPAENLSPQQMQLMANKLDELGMYKKADIVTDLMIKYSQINTDSELRIHKIPRLLCGHECSCGCGEICDDDNDILVVEHIPNGKSFYLKNKCYQFLTNEYDSP